MDIHDYNYLLNQMQIKYGEKYAPYIKEFLLNVILVLNGARTAYRIFIPSALANDLMDTILNMYPDITINRYDEPLLFLTKNKYYVDEHYIDSLGMGKVLGYCYNGNDWANLSIDRLAVSPTASDKYNDITLFVTMVPKYAYNGKVVDCILNQIKLYNSILNAYGFEVTLSISLFPKK